MTSDPDGGIVIIDRHSLLRWTPATDKLELLAGSSPGFSGDNGPAAKARFNWPQGIAIDKNGDIFLADTENCRLRKINASSGVVTTIADTGRCESTGDNGAARNAHLYNPRSLAIDSHHNLFVSEGCRVRKISATGTITTYAGGEIRGFSGDGGDASLARVSAAGLAVDQDDNLYISDYEHNRIRRVDAVTHTITTIAGDGLPHRVDLIL